VSYDRACYFAAACAKQATQDLIEAAATKWREVEGDYRDDITAVVVRLPCFPE